MMVHLGHKKKKLLKKIWKLNLSFMKNWSLIFYQMQNCATKFWERDVTQPLPINFEELEQFKNGHLLNCCLNMSKEAINYETQVLHFSTHMFFEKPENKKELHTLVKQFVFKINQAVRK